MNDEQKEKFYKDIPLFMRHCPHLFVMQQQMRMQKEMMMRQQQQQQQSMDHNHSHGHGQNNSLDPQMMETMTSIMNDPAARAKMESLSSKMSKCQSKVAGKITTWSPEQKKDFFEEFSRDPLLDSLNACGVDAMKRLEKFQTLSDEEIERIMTLQLLMMEMMPNAQIRHPSSNAGASSSGVLGTVFGALGSMLSSSSGKQSGGATMDHSHVHSASCQHAQSSSSAAPDVTTGKLDSMDR